MANIRCPGKKLIWPELLGKRAEEAKQVVEQDNPAVKAIIVKAGYAVTHDYRCDRVWLWTNKNGIIFIVPKVG